MQTMFHTPPENQGQAVIVSYASVDGFVIRRWHDQSVGETRYAIAKALTDDDGTYWNAAPKNKRWRKISAERALRMIETDKKQYADA